MYRYRPYYAHVREARVVRVFLDIPMDVAYLPPSKFDISMELWYRTNEGEGNMTSYLVYRRDTGQLAEVFSSFDAAIAWMDARNTPEFPVYWIDIWRHYDEREHAEWQYAFRERDRREWQAHMAQIRGRKRAFGS